MLAPAASYRAMPSTLNAVDGAPLRWRQEAAWVHRLQAAVCRRRVEDRS
jgi:hypothetical protein